MIFALLWATVSGFQTLPQQPDRFRFSLPAEVSEDGRIWSDQWPLNDFPLDPPVGNRAQQAPNLSQREVQSLGWSWWDQPLDRERDPPSVWKRWKWMEGSQGDPNLKPATTNPYESHFKIQ